MVFPGDGCAAPAHKPKPRNIARFTATQERWRTDVAAGSPVVEWPVTRAQTELQVVSPCEASDSE